jgi:uncharacterized protein (TIGR02246 family)
VSDEARLDDRLAIERLNKEFGHQLDRGDADGFAALFTRDALYTNGDRVSKGRDAVREFYIGRTAGGERTSRHFATGLIITFDGQDWASGISVCATYSALGRPEIRSTIPAVIADFEDRYERVEGCWLIAVRHIRPIFRAPA